MIPNLDANQVLAEIAREIDRPTIAGRELDAAVTAVRDFCDDRVAPAARALRGEAGEFAGRQAQLDEMVLDLLGEIASAAAVASRDARHADRFVRGALAAAAAELVDPALAPAPGANGAGDADGAGAPPALAAEAPCGAGPEAPGAHVAPAAARAAGPDPGEDRWRDPSVPSLEDVAAGATADFIRPRLTARDLPLPLVGRLVGRLQARAHLLSLSYAQQVAVAQEQLNQSLAERLLALEARTDRQEETIESLTLQLAAARRRIAALEGRAAAGAGA